MNAPLTTAEEDLAYLRTLVDSDRGTRMRYKFGVVYLVSGLLWGLYALIVWAANAGLMTMGKQLNSLLWLIVMVRVLRRNGLGRLARPRRAARHGADARNRRCIRRHRHELSGDARRADVGLVQAEERRVRRHLLRRRVAGQGAGWYVFWVLRRERWIALVAIGWYLAALLTGFNMRMPDFLLYMGISMLLLMALPGWLMVRRNAAASA